MKKRHNQHDEAIRLMAVGLEAGTTSPHVVCPKCSGGRTSEASLRITRSLSGRLSWYCFRASCGYRAWSHQTGNAPRIYKLQAKEPRIFRGATEPLRQAQVRWLNKRFDFTIEELTYAGVMYAQESHSTYWPVRSSTGMHRGGVLRSFAGGMKACNYQEKVDEPWLSWYPSQVVNPQADQAVVSTLIVEDQLSALKGSRVADTVALMGTALSLEKLMEIVKHNNNKVLLLLDADATAKAVRFLRRFSWVSSLTVKPLTKDLKYYTTEEMEELL